MFFFHSLLSGICCLVSEVLKDKNSERSYGKTDVITGSVIYFTAEEITNNTIPEFSIF
jgi:hypothetical protein